MSYFGYLATDIYDFEVPVHFLIYFLKHVLEICIDYFHFLVFGLITVVSFC